MIKNKNLKRRIVEVSYSLGLSHIGSCLTAIDIIKEIYDIKKPDEKFVLSAGHAHLAHLVVMYSKVRGKPPANLNEVCETIIKKYGIHCDRKADCDASTGSLGHGIGIAVGMALADRSKDVYCLLSDGELAEGSVWESIRIWREQELDNLKIYVNCNGYGAYRTTETYEFPRDLEIIQTSMEDYPEYLQGLMGHYKVLNKKEYNELMEVLK